MSWYAFAVVAVWCSWQTFDTPLFLTVGLPSTCLLLLTGVHRRQWATWLLAFSPLPVLSVMQVPATVRAFERGEGALINCAASVAVDPSTRLPVTCPESAGPDSLWLVGGANNVVLRSLVGTYGPQVGSWTGPLPGAEEAWATLRREGVRVDGVGLSEGEISGLDGFVFADLGPSVGLSAVNEAGGSVGGARWAAVARDVGLLSVCGHDGVGAVFLVDVARRRLVERHPGRCDV